MILRALAFWRRRDEPRPELTLADIARYISDPERAPQALWDLQHLIDLDLADAYLPAGWVAAGHRDFNVWLNRRLAPPSGQRITLEDWCARWLAREDGWRQWVADVLSAPDDDEPGGAA